MSTNMELGPLQDSFLVMGALVTPANSDEEILKAYKTTCSARTKYPPIERREDAENGIKNPKKSAGGVAEKVIERIANMKMTQNFIRWIFPLPTPEGKHLEWPGYRIVGTKLEIKLETEAYDSRCLLENTVASFYPTLGDRNLTPAQIAARDKIISLVTERKENKEPVSTREMEVFMKLFDTFFFCGALVNTGRPRTILQIWNRGDLFVNWFADRLSKPDGPLGTTSISYLKGYGPVSWIDIAGHTFFKTPVPLTILTETLIHEMVHAYMLVFMCVCPTCERDFINTRGIRGHGPTFLMLLDCIDQTLKVWFVGLTGLVSKRYVFYCAAGATCPEAEGHSKEGYRGAFIDEIFNLRSREQQLVEKRGLPATYYRLIGNRASGKVIEIENKPETPGQHRTAVNGMRTIHKTEGDEQIYMTHPQVGCTYVEEAILDRASDTVQALLAKTTTESPKKLLTKINLPTSLNAFKIKPQQKARLN